jgi:hypothetical protein
MHVHADEVPARPVPRENNGYARNQWGVTMHLRSTDREFAGQAAAPSRSRDVIEARNMTQHEWEKIEKTLAVLSIDDKRELVERITHSIRAKVALSSDLASSKREKLDRVREELAAMPVVEVNDGRSSRDHDEILYGNRS